MALFGIVRFESLLRAYRMMQSTISPDSNPNRRRQARRILGFLPSILLASALLTALEMREVLAQTDADGETLVARQRFEEGVKHYDAKEYDKARLAFLQAYLLKAHPAVLLNLAPSDDIDDPVPFVARAEPSGSDSTVALTARNSSRLRIIITPTSIHPHPRLPLRKRLTATGIRIAIAEAIAIFTCPGIILTLANSLNIPLVPASMPSA